MKNRYVEVNHVHQKKKKKKDENDIYSLIHTHIYKRQKPLINPYKKISWSCPTSAVRPEHYGT